MKMNRKLHRTESFTEQKASQNGRLHGIEEFMEQELTMDKRKEWAIQCLKERGLRITKQRKMILDIILEEECYSCKEIYYKAHALFPGIGTATVYRMVNLLEDIGMFDRRNMYRIFCGTACDRENMCVIEFEDSTSCQLSAQKWHEVLAEGLKACGYADNKKVSGVLVYPCTNGCC